MLKPIVVSFIRHGLTLGAGVLVARGYVDASGADSLIGAGLAVFSVIWSIAEKRVAFLKA